MKKQKNGWSNLKYWQKGIFFGFLLYVFFLLSYAFIKLYFIGGLECSTFSGSSSCSFQEFVILVTIYSFTIFSPLLILSILFGALGGFIIDKLGNFFVDVSFW